MPQLEQRVTRIENELLRINTILECVGKKLHIVRNDIYYLIDGSPDPNIELNLNDWFPLDQCVGSKGIMITRDALIFCEQMQPNEWQMIYYYV